MATNSTSREFAGPGLVEQFLSSLYKGAKADLNLFKKGWVATGGAMEDAGKAFYNWATTPAQPQIQTTSQEAGRAAGSALRQQEVYGQQPPVPAYKAPLGVPPAHMLVSEPSVNTYSEPAVVAPLGAPTLMDQGPDYMRASTPLGDYVPPEEEGGFKFDQQKWNDTLAGLAALAPPKDLPTPTLNLNQIQASTVQGGGGQRTPFNPDNTASTAFKDRTTAPQILKFLR